ncbi:hypothetical protein AB0K74_42615 [Streptomyces sp. NPDC056159]|uniref:hypothetical protein n=1 Tax=Streptomyces sp. NPDC056159 TaxID=3155537 RepID=UPI003417DF8C
MSPEQARGGPVGPASDVFSLGAVVAYAATGIGPFGEGRDEALLYRIVSAEPRLDGVPGPLRDLVADCLHKDPALRPTLAGLARAIADRWTPPEELPGAVPWPASVTRLIQGRQAPTPDASAAGRQHGGAITHPPTERASAAPSRITLTPAVADQLFRRAQQARRVGYDGNPAEAARMSADLAADYTRLAGPNAPHTLHSRYDQAHFVGKAGDLAQAARLMASVASDYARVLGPDTLTTLNIRHEHACLVGEAGDPAQAAQLMAAVAADKARFLGMGHSYGWNILDTLQSRQRHAIYVGKAGDSAQATRLMADVITAVRGFGRDHIGVLTSRYWHACFVGDAGDPAQASRLMVDVATDMARVLGPDHAYTLASRRWLAYWQKRAAAP